MKVANSLVDDAGVEWEFRYEEDMFVPVLDGFGEPVTDEDGRPLQTSRINALTFRKETSAEWLTLPPWADVREEWKINLCFFDEDDDGEMTFWEVAS